MKMLPMLSLDETRTLLSKTIFADLDGDAVSKLHPIFERQAITRGEFLRKIGEPSADLYIIESGSFGLCDADHSILAKLSPGDTIGVLGALFGGPQLMNTQAYDDSTFLVIDAGSLKMLERSNPTLSLQILRCLRKAASDKVTQAMRLLMLLYQG